MADKVTNYKCPACTGPLHFDSATGRLKCDYCGSAYDVSEIEALYKQKNADAAAADAAEESKKAKADGTAPDDEPLDWQFDSSGAQWGANESGIKAFNCPSCGAEIICDETTAATSCPYCDNPTIVPSNVSGSLKPDAIVPFKLDKEAAKTAFRNHLKGKKLLPRLFSEESHLDEIKGIYVPFWLFDADADASMVYTGKKLRHWSDADYNYTETSVYDLVRGGSLAFDSVPVDGSKKMDDALMESVEPFDVTQAVDFKTAYLAGYLADKYDVAAEDCVGRANARIKQSVKDEFASTTFGFDSVTPKSASIRLSRGRARYTLLPVWILNTTWNGEKYVFAMNGQTGKFVGNLPCDKALRRKWHFIYAGIFAAALYAIEWLLYLA